MQSGQAAAVDGDRNIVIQVAGSGNVTTVTRGPSLTLRPLNKLRSAIRNEVDILKPGSFAIPYVGRERDLADLWKWLRSEQRMSVRVLTGRGGSGKTRLALRLLEEIESSNDWQAGFADHEQLRQCSQQPGELTCCWTRPTLIVVDYAATCVVALRDLIRRLPMNADEESTASMRILLLERHADSTSGWMNELVDRGWTNDSRVVFDPPEPVRIEPIAMPEQRRAVLRGALQAAARFHPHSACNVPTPGADPSLDEHLVRAEWQDPLLLMMAALTAIETGWRHAFSLSRTDLAKEIAAREAQRISRFGSEREGKLLRHMAAVLTLHGGLSRNALLVASREECEALSGTFEGGADAIVDRLTEALPSSPETSEGASAVLPDIIGEAFILRTLADSAQDGVRTVLRAMARNAGAVAAVIRTAVDFYGVEADDSRARRWLDTVFDGLLESESPPVLLAMEMSLPRSSLALDRIALRVVLKRLLLVSKTESRDERSPEHARLLGESVRLLSALGRPEEALANAQAAVDLYREPARARPDAFRPDLASSLNNLANMLSYLGRREEALATAQEAVELYRELARARPDAFRPDLASSLNNLANRLSNLGRREEALATAQEAVDHYRELARARPDAFLPGLAMSLNNVANRLSDLGRREEALATAQEAVNLRRELARARPDAFRPDLASSLNNLANMLSYLGRREEALSTARKAVELYRELARARPDAFLPGLALSLNNLANGLRGLGRPEEALATAQEAVDLYRELARARPDAFLPDLALSLNNLANGLRGLGRPEEALATARKAVELYRELARARPDAFLPDLAMSLNNLANVLSDLGQREEALATAQEAVNLRRELARARPDAFLPDLAMSLSNLAKMLSDLGRREEALATVQEAVNLRRELARARPDAFLPDLVRSLWVLGDVLRENNEPERGLEILEEAFVAVIPFVERMPKAFRRLALGVAKSYAVACAESGIEPRQDLGARLAAALQADDAGQSE